MAPTARFSWFWCGIVLVTGLYLAFLLALIVSTATYTTTSHQLAHGGVGDARPGRRARYEGESVKSSKCQVLSIPIHILLLSAEN